jgi:hypothetical protein
MSPVEPTAMVVSRPIDGAGRVHCSGTIGGTTDEKGPATGAAVRA